MFEKFKNLFKKQVIPAAEPKKTTPKKAPVLSEKEQATAAGEPYIKIVALELDPENINSGSFEMDWNSKFVANLARAGYQKKAGETEDVIVDRWFQTICRNIALEVYEQEMADPINRELDDLRKLQKRDLGNGRSEIS